MRFSHSADAVFSRYSAKNIPVLLNQNKTPGALCYYFSLIINVEIHLLSINTNSSRFSYTISVMEYSRENKGNPSQLCTSDS